MLQNASQSRSYSASTAIWLMVDDQRIEVGQMGTDFIISNEDAVLPRGTRCELHATVEAEESVWSFLLPDGLGSDGREACIVVCDQYPDDDIPF